jgi:hypothetical protein
MPTLIVSSAALAGADIIRPAATTLAETIFVIVEKLPLIRKTPKLVDCTATTQCNPRANRHGNIDNQPIIECYQTVISPSHGKAGSLVKIWLREICATHKAFA